MCGIAGSGKSTWIKNNVRYSSWIVSRDAIRKNLIGDESYFSKEKEVFSLFIDAIQKGLDEPNVENIYIDATHINERSRMKVLNALSIPEDSTLNVVWLNTPLTKSLERNELREGFELVPKSAIMRMDSQFEPPTEEEFHRYHFKEINIIEVKE